MIQGSGDWLSVGEAAEVAQVARITVHRAIVDGSLLCAWTPLGRLLHRKDVKAWRAQHHGNKKAA
jgi:predicted site-specific integrase-resolvase